MKTADKASHLAYEAVEKIAGAGSQSAEAFANKGEQLKNAERQLMENFRNYISDKPISSVEIAVGGGLSVNSTLLDYMITIIRIVIPAWIAGIQSPWMDFSLPSLALDTRFPAGMTSLRII